MLGSWRPRWSARLGTEPEPEPEPHPPETLSDSNLSDHSEQYGLFPLATPNDTTTGSNQAEGEFAVDFVAVHGLGGDAYRTWTHANGNLWLRNVQDPIPGARVYTFGMGGLVVKQAFLIANNESEFYPRIKEAIPAILFLGTPHTGSNTAAYAAILSTIANVFIGGSQSSRVVGSIRSDLLQSLKKSEPQLLRIAREFRMHTKGIQITSFIEQKTMLGLKERAFDESSGVMNAGTERIVPMQGLDHREMCKHPSSGSQGLVLIIQALKDAVNTRKNKNGGDSSAPAVQTQTPRPLILAESDATQKDKALLNASEKGVLTAVARLLENGADLHTYDKQFRTPLHLAILHGHVNLVHYFVFEKAANVREEDVNGLQALHMAAKTTNSTITAILLQNGADVNAEDKDGSTPLHWAAVTGDEWNTHCLLQAGGDAQKKNNKGETPIRLARRNRHLYVMHRLQGVVTEEPSTVSEMVNSRPSNIARKHIPVNHVIANVIILSFNPDAGLAAEDSPLYRATQRGDLERIENLLDEGHIPSARVLYLAAKNGDENVVDALVYLVDDIDKGIGWMGNALCGAASMVRGRRIVETLLDNSADVNWQGGHYGNALQTATAHHRLDIVKLLVSRGADVSAQGGHYGNALTAAARHRTDFKEMATLFLENDADINAQGTGCYGNPLQTAVWIGRPSSVKFLLDRGASATASGQFGSAIEIAERGLRFTDYDTQRMILALLNRSPSTIEDDYDLIEPRRS